MAIFRYVTVLLLLVLWFGVAAATPVPSRTETRKTHIVKQGESLYTIARKSGMRVEQLKRLNGLKSNNLKPGQVLQIAAIKKGKDKKEKDLPEPQDERTTRDLVANALTLGDDQEPEALGEGAVTDGGEGLQRVVRTFLAIPYRFGAESRKSTDCSGFVQQVFDEFDIKMPRTAREQYRIGAKVPREELQTGDLLFFRTYARYPSHVGIYIGNGKMIHASRYHRKVVISDIDHTYFRKRYLGAKRVAMFVSGEFDLDRLSKEIEEINDEGMLEKDAAPEAEPQTPAASAVVPADAPAQPALTAIVTAAAAESPPQKDTGVVSQAHPVDGVRP